MKKKNKKSLTVLNFAKASQSKDLKFWNFIKNEQTNTAELTIYGPIASRSWWEDEVTPAQFSNDLKNLGDVDEITVRINSGGGDVFAANAIQNMLKDHKAKIKIKIDGWAASAATIIAMAGDEILIPKNGIFMIHNPTIGLFGNYEKSDFDNLISILETTKKSIITSYADRTGKEENEIAELMDAETWFVGSEAVENGFCDALTNEAIENSVNNSFITNYSGEYKNVPKKIRKLLNKTKNKNTKEDKMGEKEKITNEEELKAKYPNLIDKIIKNAVEGERQRIKEIEDITMSGFEDLTNAAKFSEPITASELAVKVIAKQKEQGKDFLSNRQNDIENSKVNEVKPSEQPANDGESKYDKIIDSKYPKKEGK